MVEESGAREFIKVRVVPGLVGIPPKEWAGTFKSMASGLPDGRRREAREG